MKETKGWVARRGDVWYLNCHLNGKIIRESLKTTDRDVAEARLRRRIAELKEQVLLSGALDRVRAKGELTGADVLLLRAPLVYVWYRGDAVLYVGRGRGLGRPLDPAHHRLSGIQPTDVVRFWKCASTEEADVLEGRLIAELAPTLNVRLTDRRENHTP